MLGDDSELPLAARVSGLSEDAARQAADDLVRADIFVAAERLGFVHPIVRAALYEDLAPGERQARHAAAAGSLAAGRRLARARHRSPAADRPDRGRSAGSRTLRSAATSAARRGAPARGGRAAAARAR